MKLLSLFADASLNFNKEKGEHEKNAEEKEDEEDIWEHNPSLSEMVEFGVPPDYLAIVIISFFICIAVIVMFIRAANEHRAYSTKYTMQSLCTVGVIFTFPVFVVMYFSGMIVPKAMSKVTYIAETYEAISLLFFLRLLLTYLGGKKETRVKLTDTKVQLNSPPICCMTFLPKVNFTKRFLLINEIFIIQLVVFQLVLGYIDLLIGIDESHSHPTDLIEHEYSQVYHILTIVSFLLAVYGLGGIYHTAEEHLKHYQIYRKFILYEAFVRVVKVEEIILSYVITHLVKRYGINLNHGALRAELRVHMWCYFLIEMEAVLVFPFLIRAYSTADYPKGGAEGERDLEGVVLENVATIRVLDVDENTEGFVSPVQEKLENGEMKTSEGGTVPVKTNGTEAKNLGGSVVLEEIEEFSDDGNNGDGNDGFDTSVERECDVTSEKEAEKETSNETDIVTAEREN